MSSSNTTIAQVASATSRAATDAAFRSQVLSNPASALQSAGIAIPAGSTMQVLENTSTLVNLIVPPKPANASSVPSGLDPYSQLIADAWNDPAVAAELQQHPNAVLAARGVSIPAGVQVKVTQAAANVLYFVIPPAQGGAQ